ncbi:hypothetical protein ACHAW6_005459, partial [Cyclotella cf. meneghiniana]
NAAKCASQTFKNHLISGLFSTDHDFPSQLWDKLQSMKYWRGHRILIIISGPHQAAELSFTRPADNRTSWGPCGTNAWYISPSMNHYCSYEFYVPETRAYQISASAQFFLTYCEIPTETSLEAATEAAT